MSPTAVHQCERGVHRTVDRAGPVASVCAMSERGQTGRVVDGRFELLERLGSGGMGTVWRARDVGLHREVAIKEVRPADAAAYENNPALAAQQRERVMRESRALARLQRPVERNAGPRRRGVTIGLDRTVEPVAVQVIKQVAGQRAARRESPRIESTQILQRRPELIEFRAELIAQLLAGSIGEFPDLANGPTQPGRRGRQTFRAKDQQPGDDEDEKLTPADVEHLRPPPHRPYPA